MNRDEIIDRLNHLESVKGLELVSSQFASPVKFSSALGKEDQLLTHWIAKNHLPIEIFTLDTGRLFQESYDLLDLTRKQYQVPIKVYFPDAKDIEQFVNEKGLNNFYESVENRKSCCHIRKVKPLHRALDGASVWITGIRSEQSLNRKKMKPAEWNEEYQLIKYNPILHLSSFELNEYIKQHNIPINTLYRKGFSSIGCLPCTRAVLPGEDSRAGRWWWESSSRECGLHETVV